MADMDAILDGLQARVTHFMNLKLVRWRHFVMKKLSMLLIRCFGEGPRAR